MATTTAQMTAEQTAVGRMMAAWQNYQDEPTQATLEAWQHATNALVDLQIATRKHNDELVAAGTHKLVNGHCLEDDFHCPACCSDNTTSETVCGVERMHRCRVCRCVFGVCTREDSYKIVLPSMRERALGQEHFYNFLVVGGTGDVTRRHGMFDTLSRQITQVG